MRKYHDPTTTMADTSNYDYLFKVGETVYSAPCTTEQLSRSSSLETLVSENRESYC